MTKKKTEPKVVKPSVKYVEGNLFENIKGLSNIVIAHVCNDIGAWGSGFVVPLGITFPESRKSYLTWYQNGLTGISKFGLGEVMIVPVDPDNKICVANMVAQRDVGGTRPLRYNALCKCMEKIVSVMEKGDSIHAPLFGSQLAGGRWDFIAELIQDIWVDKGLDVTIHYLPGTLPEGF